MFRFFQRCTRSKSPTDADVWLPDELWAIIFSKAGILSLHNILWVSHRFKTIAQSDLALAPILELYQPYFGNPRYRKIPEFRNGYGKNYQQLTTNYEDWVPRYVGLYIPRFLSFIIENDLEQMTQLGRHLTATWDPSKTAQIKIMLIPKTADGKSLLQHLNDQHNQAMRDVVFQIYIKQITWEYIFSFIQKKNEGEPLHIWHFIKSPYAMACALNQINYIKGRDYEPHDHYVDGLEHSVKYGFLDIVKHIVTRYGSLKLPKGVITLKQKAVNMAVRYNQPKILSYLLSIEPLKKEDICGHISLAMYFNGFAVVPLLAEHVSAADLFEYISTDRRYEYFVERPCQYGYVEALRQLFTHCPDLIWNANQLKTGWQSLFRMATSCSTLGEDGVGVALIKVFLEFNLTVTEDDVAFAQKYPKADPHIIQLLEDHLPQSMEEALSSRAKRL